jgi:beta-glucanase (GH16 family)
MLANYSLSKTLQPLAMAVILTLLTACGGGGGGSVPTPSPAPNPEPTGDQVAPVITLTGSTSITIEQGTDFSEPGWSASDNVDDALTVTTEGTVNSDLVGVYTLTYSTSDSAGNTTSVTRTVTVVDTTPPVISLNGAAEITHSFGEQYVDAGATATDSSDGEITPTSSGTVDVNSPGAYTITYSATDAAGNNAIASRTVNIPVANQQATSVVTVLQNGLAGSLWTEGLVAFDQGIGWQACSNDGGEACPNIAWELATDAERGDVLKITTGSNSSQLAGFYVGAIDPLDMTGYADGNLLFDIKVVSGDANFTMKIDCVMPCTTGDQLLGEHGASGWETVTIPVSDLVTAGLELDTVSNGLVIWATNKLDTVFLLDDVRWEVEGSVAVGNGGSGIEIADPLVVFDAGAVGEVWDLGLNGYDQEINYAECSNDGGAACPNIAWSVVDETDRGSVLEISHSSAGQIAAVFAKTSTPYDASTYAGGNIVFDVKVISGSSNLSMKVDCVYPCSSGDYGIGSAGSTGWETVMVPVNNLVAQDLDLTSVDTGIVIWATDYTDTVFRIDNIRWVAAEGGPTTGTGSSNSSSEVWVNPNLTGYSTPETYAGYSLLWSDEFSATELDTTYWTYETGTGSGGWGNNELQYYRSNNTSVKEGLLVIEARKENFGGRQYTSSRIKTQGKLSFKYGRVDVRAAMPEGKGLWPALWMMGENISSVGWPYCGEIDIMEMVGGSGGEARVVGTAHWNSGGLGTSYSPASYGDNLTLTGGETLANKFHVFSLVWTENSLTWYIDDVEYHVMAIDDSASLSAFQKDFFLLFNVAVGGNWPGVPNANTSFPQRMLVDYVRVFQAD